MYWSEKPASVNAYAATTKKLDGCDAVAGITKFVGSISKNPLPRLDVKSIVHVTVDASATVIPAHSNAATPNVSPDFINLPLPESALLCLHRELCQYCIG
jgi:hypothetical protein